MSRPVIALAAFSLAAVFRSEAEDNQHGNHRKNQQEVIIGTVPALYQGPTEERSRPNGAMLIR
jgi:hypothetical protein